MSWGDEELETAAQGHNLEMLNYGEWREKVKEVAGEGYEVKGKFLS